VFVHPLAICESTEVGEGTRVWAFAHIMAGAVVGRDCNLGEAVFVERGATLGDRVTVKNHVLIWEGVTIADDVFVGPGVLFTNDRLPRSPRMAEVKDRYAEKDRWLVRTRVERGASLGAGAVLLPGADVGRFAMIAAGAVVTRPVAPHRLVAGNPARSVGWVCRCGARLGNDLRCPACAANYRVAGEGVEDAA
jgi:UDP-2-acetamido-3-amino-2,3-dideoxy-glucuronate N-acetyltransferase